MSVAAKFETVTPRMPSKPAKPLPPGACDTHAHVFGPYDVFPFAKPSSYPPPLAPFELHSEMLATIGAERGVLVQPAPYGTDNSALTDALRRSDKKKRGVAVAIESISDNELDALYEAGVRGLRFNEMIDSGTGSRFAGSVGIDHLKKLAPRMKELGLHAQIWARCEDCPSITRELGGFSIPLVFEHMTSFSVQRGTADPAFREILTLLSEGDIWVKLSVCRNSKSFPDYDDVRPFHDAMIEANPGRLLWASDWPYVRMGDLSPDAGHLIDLFRKWVGDEAVCDKILVENPASLYGFPGA